MKIMVVDDEIVSVTSLARGLRSKGHQVVTAQSAHDALETITSDGSGLDLIMTDYQMPEMNGIDLLKTIRLEKKRIPVIIMTALANRNIMMDAIKAGCDGFLAKPFNLDELIWEIEKVRALSDRTRHSEDAE
jgi:DNA-binding response OmpR family regulator